jgi:hypothetical protein
MSGFSARAVLAVGLALLLAAATSGAALGAVEHDRMCPRPKGLVLLTTEQSNQRLIECGR